MKFDILNPEDILTTFGSRYDDDEYYVECRTPLDKGFSFLALWTTEDNRILVNIGEGEESPNMDLDDFEALIKKCRTDLEDSKANWLKHKDS